jgi:hypothetical protein
MVARIRRKIGGGTGGTPGEPSGDANGTGADKISDGGNIGDVIVVDPTEARDGTATDGDAPERPRRGRKPGSRNAQKTANIDVSRLEALLIAVHLGLAKVANVPELALDPSEATLLAKSTADVAKYYPVVASALDGRIMDHIAFFGTLSMIYGTHIMAYNARTAKEARERKANAGNVHPLHA